MRERLEQELNRLLDLLPEIEAGTEKYSMVLGDVQSIAWTLINGATVDLMQSSEAVTAEETKDPEPVPTTTVQTTEENITYTKEEVREILSDAAKNGVKIQTILLPFIPEGKAAKLSSVPAASYAALVEAVNNAG